MKTCYIGRIRLSKKDSSEWDGKPPFMYVTKGLDRTNINDAIMFDKKEACIKSLVDSFKSHKHPISSSMEIMTISIHVDNIEKV
jgi:hypothetical protein